MSLNLQRILMQWNVCAYIGTYTYICTSVALLFLYSKRRFCTCRWHSCCSCLHTILLLFFLNFSHRIALLFTLLLCLQLRHFVCLQFSYFIVLNFLAQNYLNLFLIFTDFAFHSTDFCGFFHWQHNYTHSNTYLRQAFTLFVGEQ